MCAAVFDNKNYFPNSVNSKTTSGVSYYILKKEKKKKTTIERATWKDNSKTDKNTNKVY